MSASTASKTPRKKSGYRLTGDVAYEEVAPQVLRHHPRPRRRRPDDHRDADEEHAAGS